MQAFSKLRARIPVDDHHVDGGGVHLSAVPLLIVALAQIAVSQRRIGIIRALRLCRFPIRQGLSVPDAFPAPDGFRLSSSDIVRGGEGVPVRVVHPDPGTTRTFVPEAAMPAGWYQFELAFAPEG
ncbi:MAG TPA: hypothetical protein VNM70_08505, partial [Burkholderiales bacterium]|nr:hypothetical protein [Burkholderiales bacterium]